MLSPLMSVPIAFAALAFVAFSAAAPMPADNDEPSFAVASSSREEVVPNSRIIILTPGADSEAKFKSFLQESINQLSDDLNLLAGMAAATDASAKRVLGKEFSSDKMSIVTGIFDDEFVEMAKARPEVQKVLPNMIHHIFEEQRDPPSYGLPRISSRREGKSSYLYPESGGEGVTVYVLDTGIRASHVDFEGRAELGLNAVDGARSAADDNGHGTHVAATIAGKRYGVAKKAKVVGVKVCSAKGSCTTKDIVEGIMWTINDAKTKPKGKIVVNMSLGGNGDEAIDMAVQTALDEGLVVAVAAGNDARDACKTSPGRVSGAVTVAAIDSFDRQAKYSNFGPCVDIYAPGSHIKSAWYTDDNAEKVLSGTSMSSPHTAGVMALIAAEGTHSNVEISEIIIKMGTRGEVEKLGADSPNLLLFNNGGVPVDIDKDSNDDQNSEDQLSLPSDEYHDPGDDSDSADDGYSSEDGPDNEGNYDDQHYDEEHYDEEHYDEEHYDDEHYDDEHYDESGNKWSSEDAESSGNDEEEAGSSDSGNDHETDGDCNGDECDENH